MATTTATDPGRPAAAPATDRRRRLTDWAWAVPGAVAGAAAVWVAHRGLIDDAYITLGYVREMATSWHWGLIPTEESNTATSPLNVLLLTACTWLVRLVTGDVRPVVGLGVLTVALSALLSVWAARAARGIGVAPAWALAVLAVVFANPFVNSAVGLEVVPIAALLTGLLAQAVAGRRVAFGVFAGLLVLTRLDLGVVAAAVYLLTPALRRRPWVAPAVAAALALPWYAFSWWHFGSAIPTSFVIKTLQRSFGDQTFLNGPWSLWATRGQLPLWLAVVPAAAGVATVVVLGLAGARGRLPGPLWPLVGLGLGGAAHYAAYSLLQVPPYQWYYVPTTVALGVTGTLGLALALRGAARWVAPAAALGVVAALGVLSVVSLDGRPLPWRAPVYYGSWALPEDYLAVGAAVADRIGDDTVLAPPEIGALAYGCRCSIVDPFSDPGRTAVLVQRRLDGAGPVGRFLLGLNFARLDTGEQPRPAQWRLVWTQGPVPPGAPSWPTDSPARGPATIYLERIG